MVILSRQVSYQKAPGATVLRYTCFALPGILTRSTAGVAFASRLDVKYNSDDGSADGFCLSSLSGSKASLTPAAGSVLAA